MRYTGNCASCVSPTLFSYSWNKHITSKTKSSEENKTSDMRQKMICTCVWQGADGGNRAWLSWKAAAACCGNKSCLFLRTLSQSIYSPALSIHVCFHRGVPVNWLYKRKIMFILFFALRLEWGNKFLIQHFFNLAEHKQHLPKTYITSHKQRIWTARDLLRLQRKFLCFLSRKELWLNLATMYGWGFFPASWKELLAFKNT